MSIPDPLWTGLAQPLPLHFQGQKPHQYEGKKNGKVLGNEAAENGCNLPAMLQVFLPEIKLIYFSWVNPWARLCGTSMCYNSCLKAQVPVEVHLGAEDNKESANSGLLGVLEMQKWWHPPVCQGSLAMDTHIYTVWTFGQWGWRVWGRHEGSGEAQLHPVRIWWPSTEKQSHKTGSNVHEQTLLEEQRNLCLECGPSDKSLIHNACLSPVPEPGLLTSNSRHMRERLREACASCHTYLSEQEKEDNWFSSMFQFQPKPERNNRLVSRSAPLGSFYAR